MANSNQRGKQNPNYKHGISKSRFHKIWENLRSRCTNPKVFLYHRYGGRGIKVQWRSFLEFKKDMYESYLEHCSLHGENKTLIDRKNNDGDYSEDNCRWVTAKESQRNKSNNRILEFDGRSMPLASWAEEKGINPTTLNYRLRRGWSIEKSLTTAV